jgi:hypothetical protein
VYSSFLKDKIGSGLEVDIQAKARRFILYIKVRIRLSGISSPE